MEYLKPQENQLLSGKMEVSPASKKDLSGLAAGLKHLVGEGAAAQCVFVLQSMAGENYILHCDKAVKEFGRRLTQPLQGKESFLRLSPAAKFSDVKSFSSLDKIGFQKRNSRDFHSIGLLEFETPKGQPFSLAFDLTYGTVAANEKDQDKMLVLYAPGTGNQALETIRRHYGGKWQKELELDPETGNFAAL
ncbi:MAG: hypothetical protein PHP25_04275 [Candidatus Moranbacteria bacterium]|nr:hypothetical protein [Candidatus Moranbacteria bacterium]